MQQTFTATYYLPTGQTYTATIFVSSVTITIRYIDQNSQRQDTNWLEKELSGFEEKPGGAELQYRNKNGETERLIITDPELVPAIKKQWRHNRLIGKPHQRVLSRGWTKLLIVLGIIIGLFLATYLWFVPWLGERVAMNFSKEYEISMGNQMYEALRSTMKIDARKTEMVNQFYKQLHYKIDYPIEITVVESAQVNAFAIPGGHIVVYDAILEKMKTPEELAALLGHEGSHVALRHSLRNMFRSFARKMFLALIFGNQSGMVHAMVSNADELKGLAYSRSIETAADNSGLQLMVNSGVDPEGMVRLMELLQKETGDKATNSLLSTHPIIKDRLENIRKKTSTIGLVQKKDNAALTKTFHAIFEQW